MSLPCTGKTDLFYSETQSKIAAAKRLCAECPQQETCLDVGRWVPYGVWGGKDSNERGFRRNQAFKTGIMPGKTTDRVLNYVRSKPFTSHTSSSVNAAMPELGRGSICKALVRLTEDLYIDRDDSQRVPTYRLRQKVSA